MPAAMSDMRALRYYRLAREAQARCRELIKLGRHHVRRLFDPYQPEFYYMRGPGPKWREKHGVRKMPGE
jgi:hypothetical protein